MIRFTLVPARTALLNVDMQNCLIDGSPFASPESMLLLERINRLNSACRAKRIPVIHISHVLRPDGSNSGVLSETAPIVKQGIINRGSESAALHRRLFVEPQDILLDKPRFGAFHGTDLELILRSRGIDTVIVAGLTSNVCCETTAREAAVRDFRVFFLSDGTAIWEVFLRPIFSGQHARRSGSCLQRF